MHGGLLGSLLGIISSNQPAEFEKREGFTNSGACSGSPHDKAHKLSLMVDTGAPCLWTPGLSF